MEAHESVRTALGLLVLELLGALVAMAGVIVALFGILRLAGEIGTGVGSRLGGGVLLVIAAAMLWFGRMLITQHAVRLWRRN